MGGKRIKHNFLFQFLKMPNKTSESSVREICVDCPELVALIKSHTQETDQLRLRIKVTSRTMRDVVGQDHLDF